MKGTIFNIQRFSTHDGPGIRTVVFFKGCPLRCRWCQNPESQSASPVLMQKKESCVGCGRCAAVCPHGAASIEDGVCRIDRSKCRGCGECARVCPVQALTLSGYTITVDEVMTEVLKDRSYYMNSGGGVTLSGGEATAQPDFALEILARSKAKYIGTAVETCGFVSPDVLRRFIPLTDLFLYDVKAVRSEKHLYGTGQSNGLILENLRMLMDGGAHVKLRMPLIPGYNDAREDVLALRRLAEELHIPPDTIELLKYNQLGEVKFGRLGRDDGPRMQPQSDEYFQELQSLLR